MISGILILFSGLEISRRRRRSLQPKVRKGGDRRGRGGEKEWYKCEYISDSKCIEVGGAQFAVQYIKWAASITVLVLEQ